MARGNLVSLPFQIVMHQEHVRHLYSHQLQIESHSNHLVSVTKEKVKHEIIIDNIVSGTPRGTTNDIRSIEVII